MGFLIDSIKEKLNTEDEEESNGFDDMEYLVGNTSGLDIGQVPSPIDQRVGRMAQIGGELMEIQISNPATFKIDRPELMRVIDGLEFDRVTLHGDPNIGFTSAYATGQRAAGYNIVHRYFQRYLEQMASFKRQMYQQTGVKIGYVNMHSSNEQIPPREEQIASDKSLDPFGTRFSEVEKPDYADNIYRNQEFMENLFDFFVLEKLERMEEFQLYNQIFINHCDSFEEEWSEKKNHYANKRFEKEAERDFRVKRELLQAAGGYASMLDDEFHGILEDVLADKNFTPERSMMDYLEDQSPTIALPGLGRLNQIIEILNKAKESIEDLKREAENPENDNIDFDPEELEFDEDRVDEWIDEIVNRSADELWKNSENGGRGLPYDAKLRALVNVRDNVNKRDIEAEAAEDIRDKARKVFAGDDEWFEDENGHLNILEDVIKQTGVGREIEKESTVFFNIIPAWMMSKEEGTVPRFIWDMIVETNNDNGDLNKFEDYQDFLDEDRSNELNVIAAVGVCYIWGHFTQRQDQFDLDVFDSTLEVNREDRLRPDLEDEAEMTWIEWMHEFDLKVNLEAMYGGPGELRRVWRPKDIAIACHAIDKQAKKDIEGWEESDDLVKFTIDMEHTASYGVDPWKEVEQMIELEQYMAENDIIEADPDKALAKIVKTYHLTKPGWESQSGHRHGPFARGDETLYQWLYRLVEHGFARNENEKGIVMFEVGGEYREEMYVIRVALDMIQRGIKPTDLNPEEIPLEGDYENTNQALQARFFGLDKAQFNSEMTKIEEHAFDPLDDLLEAESFDHTKSGRAHLDSGGRPQEWMGEEYR